MVRRTKSPLRSRLRRGFTLIDAVFGSLIVSVAIFGFIGLCLMMFTMTANQRNLTLANSLARLNIERIKLDGFANAQEGVTSRWYDNNGQLEASSAFTGAAFQVDRTVTSTKTQTTGGQTTPTDDAMRTVTVSVKYYPSGSVIETWGTLLSKGGA